MLTFFRILYFRPDPAEQTLQRHDSYLVNGRRLESCVTWNSSKLPKLEVLTGSGVFRA